MVRTWASRGQGCAPWRAEPRDSGAVRAHRPAALCSAPPVLPNSAVGRPESRNGCWEPSHVRRWRHTATPSRHKKLENVTEIHIGHDHSLLATSVSPGGPGGAPSISEGHGPSTPSKSAGANPAGVGLAQAAVTKPQRTRRVLRALRARTRPCLPVAEHGAG